MDLFNHPQQQRIIWSTVGVSLIVAIIGFTALLVTSASQLSQATAPSVTQGPFNMFELQKSPLSSGGYQATIAVKSGILWYAGIVAVASGLVAVWRLRLTK